MQRLLERLFGLGQASRRHVLKVMAVALAAGVLPRPRRQRRRNGPPPTGWFGHC